MKLQKYGIYLFGLVLIMMLSSCGSSKPEDSLFDEPTQEEQAQKQSQQDEMSELEALLGIKREKTPEKSKPVPQEQKDLNLLGADEGKGTAKKEEINEPVGDVRLAKMQKENQELRSQLRQKDQQIRELQSEIDQLRGELSRANQQKSSGTSTFDFGAPAQTAPVSQTYDLSEYESRYQEALNYFNQRNYDAALNIFSNLLQTDTNNKLADNIQYWIGECHYMQKNYRQALTDFEKVFTFPQSNKNDYAQFKIALCYLRLGDRTKAREEMQRFLDTYPNSPLVSRANEIMSNF